MPEHASGRLVDIVFEDHRWAVVGLSDVAERAASAALRQCGRDPDRHEIGLLACNDARIADLNGTFRDAPRPTNVLSWPAFEGVVPAPDAEDRLVLGDIAMAYDYCAGEAGRNGIALADHAAHLVVHGVLHLLGYDHMQDTEAQRMEGMEAKTLALLGIANPYWDEERP